MFIVSLNEHYYLIQIWLLDRLRICSSVYLCIYLSVSKPHYSLHPPQTLFYIVSEDENAPKRLLPGGSEGELWIGGVGVAAGYLNAPDLTKEVLVLI